MTTLETATQLQTLVDLIDCDETDAERITLAGAIGNVVWRDGDRIHVLFPSGGWQVFGPEDDPASYVALSGGMV